MDKERLKNQLKYDEGLRLKPYRCTAGKLTIGVGRNLDDVGISEKEAMMMLDTDVDWVILQLSKYTFYLMQPPGVQEALCNMAFQLGIKGLLGFNKMIHALTLKDYVNARKEALDSRWAKQTPLRAKRVSTQIGAGR